jgi:hypothetical protein
MKKDFFRFLQDGETVWQGHAYDPEHAEERAFWDETPGSLERFTLQRWGTVKLGPTMRGKGWVTVYRDACLAPV